MEVAVTHGSPIMAPRVGTNTVMGTVMVTMIIMTFRGIEVVLEVETIMTMKITKSDIKTST